MQFLSLFFKRKPIAASVSHAVAQPAPVDNPTPWRTPDALEVELGPVQPDVDVSFNEGPQLLTPADFLQESDLRTDSHEVQFVGDSATIASKRKASAHVMRTMDSVTGQGTQSLKQSWAAYQVPDGIQNWYNAQSFIGYQACALIAQHWLVDKACSLPGEDAIRNGYEIALSDESDPNVQKLQMEADVFCTKMKALDDKFCLNAQLAEFSRFRKIYGIRVCIFDIESDDPDFYAKPFNIDGVTRGSYKGIKQVDPYWMMPVMTGKNNVDPTSREFYEPTFWVIGGKKFHRSHLIIGREAQPADILKPTYIFGGIPLTQRIYERVYAAERTANEGPLLTMTKRLNVLHADLAKAEAQPHKFIERLMKWVALRDNYGIKTVGVNESVEQFDTSLADLDAVIMNQYQLVAAQARIPATKLLGTSPKGFQSNGSGEEKNYHEELESEQVRITSLADRHHLLVAKSEFGVTLKVDTVWNRVDSFTAQELAELNAKKAETGERLINLGAISPDEERNRLKNDELSGYNHLGDEEANTEMGASPENEAKLQTAEAKETEAATPDPSQGAGAPQAEGDDLAGHIQRLHGLAGGMGEDVMGHIRNLRNMVAGGNHAGAMEHIANLKAILDAMPNVTQPTTAGSTPQGTAGGTSGSPALAHTRAFVGDVNHVGLPEGGMGNYTHRSMPKIRVGRLTVHVENVKGSIRAGTALDGTEWRSQMPHHYGYIGGVIGADGDELDAFVGPNPKSEKVWVINQIEPTTGEFDEHKVMLGFDTEAEARQCYTDAYQKGWAGFDSMHEMTREEFRVWCRSGDLFSSYKPMPLSEVGLRE